MNLHMDEELEKYLNVVVALLALNVATVLVVVPFRDSISGFTAYIPFGGLILFFFWVPIYLVAQLYLNR